MICRSAFMASVSPTYSFSFYVPTLCCYLHLGIFSLPLCSSILCFINKMLTEGKTGFQFFLFFAPPQHQILGKGFLSRSCHLQSHFFLECTKSLVLSSLGVCDQHIVQWLVLGKSLTPVHHCQIWNQVCEN